MKYLILSDIHGNNVALSAVLGAVPVSRYDKILVLGDNVGDGPSPDKVLTELEARGAIMIAGNREMLATDHFGGFSETQTALQWKFMRDSVSQLSSAQRTAIAALSSENTVRDGNLAVRMVHGSPFSVRELLYRNNPGRLIECLDAIEEPILLCGHNHRQFAFLNENRLLLNPGSVGLAQGGEAFRADYALLNLSGTQFSFELNHVYYDGEAIRREYEARGLWDDTIWGQIAYREMKSGKMFIIGFARYVFNLARQRGVSTHPLPDELWLEASRTWDWVPAES